MIKKYLLFTLLILSCTACQIYLPESQKEGEFILAEKEEVKIIEVVGIIEAKEISLFDEGTHVLKNENGENIYTLKSKIEALSNFEGQKVNLKGQISNSKSENKEKIIDVLVIEPLEEENIKEFKKFELKQNGMILTFPAKWQYKRDQTVWRFYEKNIEDYLMSIETFTLESEAGIKAQKNITDAIEVKIGNRAAFRIVEDDQIDILIPDNEDFIYISFTPQDDPIGEKLIFLDILSGVEWVQKNNTETTKTEECGGKQNKLCPIGYRCELSSAKDDATGTCVGIEILEEKPEIKIQTPAVVTEEKEENITTEEPEEIISETEETQTQEESSAGIITTPEPTPIIDEEEEEIITKTDLQETTDTKNEDREIRAPSEELSEITNNHFDFKFKYPVNYYWQHFGAVGDEISVTGFSDIEMETVDDAVIVLKIVKSAVASTTEASRGEQIMILLPRDDASHFTVTSHKNYKNVLWKIAQSIEIL